MFEFIGENDPQKIFWQESQKPVPEHIETQLTALLGRDHAGDPILRVRYDAVKFKEGAWIVEEKIHPSAFGSKEDWDKTSVIVEDGIRYDFGSFPRRGIYMAVMLWCDHEGHPLEPNQDMIDRLKFQIHARQTKNISPEQVMYEIQLEQNRVEQLQQRRWDEAVDQMTEDLKRDKEKIFAATTRVQGLPTGKIRPKNILTIN